MTTAPIQPPTRIAADAEASSPGRRLVALYTFFLFCRIFEYLPVVGLGQLRLMLVISVIALLTVFLTGKFVRSLKTPLGALLVAWTVWMVVCMPFSSWRAETLNQFVNTWLKSLMVFFIIAGLGSAAAPLRAVFRALGWAAAASSLVVLPGVLSTGKGDAIGGRLIGIGSLSNPNEIAFHLWLGTGFLILLATRSGKLKKLFLFGIFGFELLLILKTVSREGLVLGAVVFAIALARTSMANKAKLIALGALLFAVGLFSLSHEALERYQTLFTNDVSSAAADSAQASSRLRRQKLQESIELTMRHPIFGVGMGVFMSASVDLAKETGSRPDWEVSHNSYTQVSSELGLPGLLLLLAIFFTAFRQVLKVDAAAKRADDPETRKNASAVLVALSVLAVHFCFDSMAYVFYMPLLLGVVAAGNLLRTEGGYLSETARPVVVIHAPTATETQPSRVPEAAATKNPYRFGRRRSQP